MHSIGAACLSLNESRSCCSSEEPFTRIWLEHRAEMLRVCRRCTRQEADAEEAFSRAGLLLFRKLPAYHGRVENLRGWILRLTFNVCMSLHRENRRRSEQSLEEIGEDGLIDPRLLMSRGGDPERAYLQKEMGQLLRSSIDNLPERLRETVIGHLRLGSYREIADHLSINEANARKRMQEARGILSRKLAQYRAGAARLPAPRRPAKPRQPADTGPAGDPPEKGSCRAGSDGDPVGGQGDGRAPGASPAARPGAAAGSGEATPPVGRLALPDRDLPPPAAACHSSRRLRAGARSPPESRPLGRRQATPPSGPSSAPRACRRRPSVPALLPLAE